MKTNTRIKGLFTAGLICFGIGISMAQPPGQKPQKPPTFQELIEKMDANEDGQLSKSEVKGPLKEMFAEVDTNDDGQITKKEFNKMPKPQGRRPSRN
jgi:Ca2+-binding EF-hand superfamily protein